jgi:hypothetical protein
MHLHPSRARAFQERKPAISCGGTVPRLFHLLGIRHFRLNRGPKPWSRLSSHVSGLELQNAQNVVRDCRIHVCNKSEQHRKPKERKNT